MSVIQSTQPELRYSKRTNLENEARVVGNYFRDAIRSYGIDCIYHKLDMNEFANYKTIVDRNTILKQAYGYNISPDYSVSAHMLTYMEVENDIFQLNKFGLNPNMDVNFYFENTDFACALATKLGQYKEYKIDEIEIVTEVPEFNCQTSADYFPHCIRHTEKYTCEHLSGYFRAVLSGYECDKEYTIVCDPYEHTLFDIEFPANSDLYRSLKHKICNDDYLETMLYLTFIVRKVQVFKDVYKYILSGRLHGSVLFYDLNSVGKYAEKLHPMVGDVIMIDFPDEKNAEKYEITDCFDKQLTQDGISPLLHKYIWKCKARRYVNSYENIVPNESDEQMQEKLDYEKVVQNDVVEEIERYPDNEDEVYGGYDLDFMKYDKQIIDPHKHETFEYLEDGTTMLINVFSKKTPVESKLVTTGYELLFIDNERQAHRITVDEERPVKDACFESGLRFLKATDHELVFTNIEGHAFRICHDDTLNDKVYEICLNDLNSKTKDVQNINDNSKNFYIFKESRTILFSTGKHLYCKLASNNKIIKVI